MSALVRAAAQWNDRRLVKKYGAAAADANTIRNFTDRYGSDNPMAAANKVADKGFDVSYDKFKAAGEGTMKALSNSDFGTRSKTSKLLSKPKKLAKVNKAMYGKPGKSSAPKEDSLF
jgi:hypothetical protein